LLTLSACPYSEIPSAWVASARDLIHSSVGNVNGEGFPAMVAVVTTHTRRWWLCWRNLAEQDLELGPGVHYGANEGGQTHILEYRVTVILS